MGKQFLRAAIVLLAGLGIWGVGQISITHWRGELTCPSIGLLPICYVILVGYSLILFSMCSRLKKAKVFFIIGWLPVTVFALLGVMGEVTGVMQCPHTESGVPKCYMSALLALTIGLLYRFLFRIKTDSKRLRPFG